MIRHPYSCLTTDELRAIVAECTPPRYSELRTLELMRAEIARREG